MSITLSYHSQDFEKYLIKNVFTNEECDEYVKENINILNIWYDNFEHLRIQFKCLYSQIWNKFEYI